MPNLFSDMIDASVDDTLDMKLAIACDFTRVGTLRSHFLKKIYQICIVLFKILLTINTQLMLYFLNLLQSV